ncbi:MAG: polysaccharide deacetylase family protein [Tenuifilaceae bacterium]
MEVLVYTQRLTSRVDYIIKFIFEDILKVGVRITSSYSEAKAYNGVLISYSKAKVKDSLHIVPHNLMIDDSLIRQQVDLFKWEGSPAFFHTSDEADIPFDLFAASFYLVSRYEEYFAYEPDKHSRLTSDQSIAGQGGFLEEPIVDQWAYKLVSKIKTKHPSFEPPQKKFEFIPTIDIDSAYAYQYKGLPRTILGSIKSLFFLSFEDFMHRIKVYLHIKRDPFDVYDNVLSMLKDWPNAIWFFLVGKYGRYDRNISIKKSAMRNLVSRVGRDFKVGIHPSYQSGTNTERVRDELSLLVDALGNEVTHSRQHYLRFFIPVTFRNLVSLGIKEDYSMGYANQSGFRAGTCTPFLFYNLKEERVVNLKLYPFQTMDFTLCQQMKLTPLQAVDHIMNLVEKVKAVNGTFISIWHNEYLSGISPWKGWELLLPLVLEKVKKLQSENQVSSS